MKNIDKMGGSSSKAKQQKQANAAAGRDKADVAKDLQDAEKVRFLFLIEQWNAIGIKLGPPDFLTQFALTLRSSLSFSGDNQYKFNQFGFARVRKI